MVLIVCYISLNTLNKSYKKNCIYNGVKNRNFFYQISAVFPFFYHKKMFKEKAFQTNLTPCETVIPLKTINCLHHLWQQQLQQLGTATIAF